MLDVVETRVSLRIRDRGPSRSWLGPALRGAVGWAWKARACRHPREQWEPRGARWARCSGCPHLDECDYGRNLEPDYPAEAPPWRSRQATPRAVITPDFPTPESFEPGDRVGVSIKLVGPYAASDLQAALDALEMAGRDRGLGHRGVRFSVEDVRQPVGTRLNPDDLPADPAATSGRIDRLTVRLATPLVLQDVQEPSFADLIKSAHQAVGSVLAMHGHAIDADSARLRSAADSVRLFDHGFEAFDWSVASGRTGRRRPTGLVGWGVYCGVPVALLPWLAWGGTVHMGRERGRGAGRLVAVIG